MNTTLWLLDACDKLSWVTGIAGFSSALLFLLSVFDWWDKGTEKNKKIMICSLTVCIISLLVFVAIPGGSAIEEMQQSQTEVLRRYE